MEQLQKQKIDGNRMMTINDDEMIMMIQKTHSSNVKYSDLELLLQLVKKMLTVTANPENEGMNEKALQKALVGMPEALATIHKISCELSCNCSGRDELSTTLELFNMMSRYSWDTKVVLALAAFALIYGELNLVAVIFSEHPMAKAIKLLKQFPQESRHFLSSRTLTILIETIVNTTNRVVDFNSQSPENFSTHSHTAVYWVVRSVVTCASHFMGLVGLDYKSIQRFNDTATLELSKLNGKVSESRNLLEQYWQSIEAAKQSKFHETLDHLFKSKKTVNTEIFKKLFNAKDDQQPLLISFPEKQLCGVDVLRGKNVILAISESVEWDEDLEYLSEMYQKSMKQPTTKQGNQYEVVWLPLLDEPKVKGDIQHIEIKLPWYMVHYDHIPSANNGVTTYIKKKWQFNKKSILVMLDEQGKIVSPNAIHMLRIFGRFDLTAGEEYIRKKVNWGLEFWFDGIDKNICEWIRRGSYFCLYGGEDLEWIKNFSNDIQKVVGDTNIKIEMMYVGRQNLKDSEKKKKILETAKSGKKCFLENYSSFWSRLESMFYYMMQNMNFEEDNHQMLDITTMLSFNGSEKGWALINKGSTIIAKASGDKISKCIEAYGSWKPSIAQIGFAQALSDYLEKLKKEITSHCNHLTMSEATGRIPESLKCMDCGHRMEKLITFRCCTE